MNNEEVMSAEMMSVTVCERSVIADANTEYTLPEYFPEIRKLLHIEQTVMPPAKYVNSSSAQLNGTVDYKILYVGADGSLYSAPVSTEYSVNMPIDMRDGVDSSAGLEMSCGVCTDSISSRVVGPRRISIRGRIRCAVRVIGKIKPSEELVGEVNPLSIYKKIGKANTAEYGACLSDMLETEYEIAPLGEGERVADAEAKLFVKDISLSDTAIICRGDMLFSALTVNEMTGEHKNITQKLPFESELESDIDLTDAEVRAWGIPCEIRVEVEEDRAICKIGAMIEARCLAKRSVEYTEDLYSSERSCTVTHKEYECAEALLCKNGNMTISERLGAEDTGVAPDAKLITSFGSATVDSCRLEDGKYIFDGTARFSLIYLLEKEYSCTDINIPFRYAVEGEADGENISFSGDASIISMRVSNDGAQLGIDAELAISVDCLGSRKISAVCEAEFDGETERDENTLIVCYPAPDDTLWSVAKRYAVAPSKIIGDPQIDKYIIIE